MGLLGIPALRVVVDHGIDGCVGRLEGHGGQAGNALAGSAVAAEPDP
jgi:hypothetical protein